MNALLKLRLLHIDYFYMKHIALLLVIVTSFLLTACGSDPAPTNRFAVDPSSVGTNIAEKPCIDNNPLRNAPHTARAIATADWDRPYSREKAAYPAPWLTEHKYWPPVARVDNVYGDRNFICTCPPLEAYADAVAEKTSG